MASIWRNIDRFLQNAALRQIEQAAGKLLENVRTGNVKDPKYIPSLHALKQVFDREQAASSVVKDELISQIIQAAGMQNSELIKRQLGSQSQTSQPQPAQQQRPSNGMIEISLNGKRIRARENDPLFTGEMIPVQSSNVHSIGFKWNSSNPMQSILQVRYLGGTSNNRHGEGAKYDYFECDPFMFIEFRKAGSKGKFVWDRLRVRGTVTGYQKRYKLSGLGRDLNVPREARNVNGQDWFIRRTVQDKYGNIYKSALPTQPVGMSRGTPNRGTPNRGQPNRGTPNRGKK